MTPAAGFDRGAEDRSLNLPIHADTAVIVGNSWLFRALERFFDRMLPAWRGSAIRTTVVAIVVGPNASASHRVRIAGWMALASTITHVALIGIGDLLAPPFSGLGWIVMMPVAILCIVRPAAVLAAWGDVRQRRGRRSVSQ